MPRGAPRNYAGMQMLFWAIAIWMVGGAAAGLVAGMLAPWFKVRRRH